MYLSGERCEWVISKANSYRGAMPALGTNVGAICEANPSFVPDCRLKGSALASCHKVGAAEWRAGNGETIGTPKGGASWLCRIKPYRCSKPTAARSFGSTYRSTPRRVSGLRNLGTYE